MIGREIDRYRILDRLGEGAMGVVYSAEDTQLHRRVALKFLPKEMSDDPERLERFRHEARVVAGLNHPNIVTLHSIEEGPEGPFLVMELVEGQTLDAATPSGGLPTARLLDYAIPLADALSAAHTAGTLHRDLKPSNVMVATSGRVKVLDFGLAKLTDEGRDIDLTRADTRPLTREGWLVGTVPYMSPEQVHGRSVDPRSDIFSMGCLLYQMATGRMPFAGTTPAELISSIVRDDPASVTDLRVDLPRHLARIIRRCLHKDPDRRYQTAKDLRNDLIELRLETETGAHRIRSKSWVRPLWGSRKAWLPYFGGAALGAATFASLLALRWLEPATPAAVASEVVVTRPRTIISFAVGDSFYEAPAWSPSGDWLVYASDGGASEAETGLDLWKRPLRGGEPIQLTFSPGDETEPDWSPDGRMIVFASDEDNGGLHVISADGGTPYRLVAHGRHPRWSPDGKRILYNYQGRIYWVPQAGGESTSIEEGTVSEPHAIWSADGDHILFWDLNASDVLVSAVDGSSRRALGLIPPGEEVGGLALSHGGRRLVVSKGPYGGNMNLFEVSLDPVTFAAQGPPIPLSLTATQDVQVAVSPDGSRIAYTARDVEQHLYSFPFDTASGAPLGDPKRLTRQLPVNLYPALSSSGELLVWTAQGGGQGLLYYQELSNGAERKLTPEWDLGTREVEATFGPAESFIYASTMGGSYELWKLPAPGTVPLPVSDTEPPDWDSAPTWCSSLEAVVFESSRGPGGADIWKMGFDTSSEPSPLTREAASNDMLPSCSPSGRWLAFRSDRAGSEDVWLLDLETGESEPNELHPAEEAWGAWSADERWFFFTSDRSGSFNLWVQQFPGGRARAFTNYANAAFGLPDNGMFTKFAVGADFVILPLERRSARILVIEAATDS